MQIVKSNISEIISIDKQVPEFGTDSEEDFKRRIGKRENLILTCKINNQNAGYLVGYNESKKIFYIWMAATVPKFRKKGVMTYLMNYTKKWAKKKGYKKIRLKTRNTRRAQLANLVKRNYMFVGVEKASKLIENRIYLEKEL